MTGSTRASQRVTQPIYPRLVVGFRLRTKTYHLIFKNFQSIFQIARVFPKFSRIKKIPEFSRFSRFYRVVSTLPFDPTINEFPGLIVKRLYAKSGNSHREQ